MTGEASTPVLRRGIKTCPRRIHAHGDKAPVTDCRHQRAPQPHAEMRLTIAADDGKPGRRGPLLETIYPSQFLGPQINEAKTWVPQQSLVLLPLEEPSVDSASCRDRSTQPASFPLCDVGGNIREHRLDPDARLFHLNHADPQGSWATKLAPPKSREPKEQPWGPQPLS
ncbi:rho GTPase-activating protein 40 [Marmota flaviventris]|uniref:rho GTPase-activating protein 40 n=1 Tax=Marmota flaviventris TaxID=93162 RepID=UPI003A867521